MGRRADDNDTEITGTTREAPGSYRADTRTYGRAIGVEWVAPTPCTVTKAPGSGGMNTRQSCAITCVLLA